MGPVRGFSAFITVVAAVIIVYIMLFVHCSRGPLLAGGSSEIGNAKVSGVIVDSLGNPAPGSQVKLIHERYDPFKDTTSISIDTTDASGNYVFAGVTYGTYDIQSVHCVERTRAIAFGIKVARSAVPVASITLQKPGVIKVMIPSSANAQSGYVYIPGSDIAALFNGTGEFVMLDSVPAEKIPTVNYVTKGDTATSIIRYDVPVAPGDTAMILNPSWLFARLLRMNTTSSGAGVAGTVTNFPVLVRLTQNNFDFSEAQATGDDLRFTKADSTPLPFEIERWDPVAGLAEIWVKVDTVFGNDGSHFITMYWGNPAAPGQSDGGAVFDTANGFQGIWHLNDPAAAPVKDATVNAYNGVRYNMAGPGEVGIIGIGRDFIGDSSYIIMPGTAASKLNFPENGVYSLSAWVYTDTVDSAYHTIISKGDEQYNLEILNLKIFNGGWEFAEYKNATGWDMSQSPLPAAPKQWVHVVGVRDQTRQYLYVNGQCVDSTIYLLSTYFNRYTGYDLMIGRTNGATMPGYPYYFHGVLDEIRINSRAVDPAWIKLCYMNQKMPDALIQW